MEVIMENKIKKETYKTLILYNLLFLFVAAVFYFAIPILLNYPPQSINKWNRKLILALFAGFIDGDGSIIKKTNPTTVMCAYNKVNGHYCSENKKLLTDILRNEWGFNGFVMTDWGGSNDHVEGVRAGSSLEMLKSNGSANCLITASS